MLHFKLTQFYRDLHPKWADGMAKSEDPDLTAGDLSVQKLRIIIVIVGILILMS